MAVTATFKRIRNSTTVPILTEVVSVTLSGTYVTGGFTWNPYTITAGPGTSPLPANSSSPSAAVYAADFYGSNGYSYNTVVSGSTATTEIFTSGGTQLTNGTTVPDTTLTLVLTKGM